MSSDVSSTRGATGLQRFWNTTVGAKMVMAVTGVVLLGFVIGHMLGNWQVFAGPESLNAYAEYLHTHLALTWTTRLVVLASLVLHVWAASRLTLDNRAVRPVGYVVSKSQQASWASRNMYLSGALIFAFIAYHLAQFTFRWLNPAMASARDQAGRFDVYSMVVGAFQSPIISGLYIVAMVLLGAHLWHGISSTFHSLGIVRPKYSGFIDGLGPVLATVIVLGEIAMPIAVLIGVVGR
jgi:succinate dehydrogenase / fumarate reductase cytochrome b subunit